MAVTISRPERTWCLRSSSGGGYVIRGTPDGPQRRVEETRQGVGGEGHRKAVKAATGG